MGCQYSALSHGQQQVKDTTDHLPSVQELTTIATTSADQGQTSAGQGQTQEGVEAVGSKASGGQDRVKDGKQNVVSMDNVMVHVTARPLPQTPPPAPVLMPSEELIVRAMFPFQSVNADDLSFSKGDRMKVDTSTTDLDWWLAQHLITGARGYIPSNYVCVDDNTLRAQEWWFDGDRKEADMMLLLPGNQDGTFLVRNAHDKTSHVLSVRKESGQGNEPTVKHYRIQKLENGSVFISANKRFRDIPRLIQHYSRDRPNFLCATLTQPCPRLRPCETARIQDVEICRSAITLDCKVGAGHFGEVWKGKLYKSVEVAVKTLKPGSTSPEDFLSEAKMMQHLRHRRLVRLLAVCSREEPIWIVTEFMVNGSLLIYLRQDLARHLLSFPCMLKIAAQITDGMQYLEAENLVHRDLRAANILVGEHHDVKVADFGLARLLDENAVYVSKGGAGCKFPVKWTAPEAGLHRAFSVKSDVWSFGVLLYELFTFGREPYPGFSPSEVLKVVKGGYRMPQPTQNGICCPDPVYDLMLKCWHHVPTHRPTFEFLKTFFDNYEISSESSYLEKVA